MTVFHPTDSTTAFLSMLYTDKPDTKLYDGTQSNKEIEHVLHHTPRSERILLLGHGCDRGLFWREDCTKPEFDRIVIGKKHAYHLRNHASNIVAVFCNAVDFAKANGLHGLFTGMIISEMSEAEEYGVGTTQEELDRENIKLISRLKSLLDQGMLLSEIPDAMAQMDDAHSDLTQFNYSKFFYI